MRQRHRPAPASISNRYPDSTASICGRLFPSWGRGLRLLVLCLLSLSVGGCGHLFFYPSKEHFLTPDQIGLRYQDIYLDTMDGETLHAWLLPAAGQLRGTLYFLHGNAENISTHIGSVMWLPAQGYQVLLLDYRGFGRSTGTPDIDAALLDAETGYRWLMARPETQELPVFLLGQSLGAAITTTFSAQMPDLHERVQGVILDAGFASYRGIAREKLAQFWLTWPLQYPLSWLLPGDVDPQDHIAAISPTPLLLIHSLRDLIIPYHHAETLFDRAAEPKALLTTNTQHTGTFATKDYRIKVLQFMEAVASQRPPPMLQARNEPAR